MQLHCLHANSFAFEGRTRGSDADRVEARVGNCVVVFVAVETADVSRQRATARSAADRIAEIADQLNERCVVLVPAPQLSDSPANDAVSTTIIQTLERHIERRTHAVPAGYDLSFELDTRGHPFASQHVQIEPDGRPSEREWFVVPPDADEDVRRVTPEETSTAVDDAPSVTLDERQRTLLERERDDATAESAIGAVFDRVADGPAFFDTAAEGGWLLPAGVLGRTLLSDFLRRRLLAYGAVPVQRYVDHPDAPPRPVLDERALCGAEFPISVFDVCGSGVADDGLGEEVPTLTTLLTRTQDALDEVVRQAALIHEILATLGIAYEPVIRASAEFSETHAEWLGRLAGTFGHAVLLERRPVRDERPLAVEFVLTEVTDRRAIPSVVFAGEPTGYAGDAQALAVRSTPLAAPVRVLAALIVQTARRDRPQLPLWLAPVHLRLVPVTAEHVPTCETLAAAFEAAGIRVDIDDRDIPVSERLRAAAAAWIPYDVVVGDAEVDGGPLGVTVRDDRTFRTCTPDELRDRLRRELDGWPQEPLPLARRHSQRPTFLETS